MRNMPAMLTIFGSTSEATPLEMETCLKNTI